MLDGDGLYIVTRKPELLQRRGAAGQGDARAVLTPNVNEFRRLRDALGIAASGACHVAPVCSAAMCVCSHA